MLIKSEELEHLIASQPTAMKAVRLETMMSMGTHPVSLQLLTKAEVDCTPTRLCLNFFPTRPKCSATEPKPC